MYNFDAISRTGHGDFCRAFTKRTDELSSQINRENRSYYYNDSKLGAFTARQLNAYLRLTGLMDDERIKQFFDLLMINQDKFGTYDLIIELLKLLFGAESVAIIRRSFGVIGITITNPSIDILRPYVDKNDKRYINTDERRYMNLGTNQEPDFNGYVIQIMQSFLCIGTIIDKITIITE